MSALYVTDTNSLISYFDHVFKQRTYLSSKAKWIIRQAFDNPYGDVRLSIPSVVFIEIFEKWLKDEEFAAMFYYEVYKLIVDAPNIEIRPIEREVLEHLMQIGGILTKHEVHDKIILASAMTLKCPLISTDHMIISYVNESKIIPSVIT
jgi:PIN domain nuclease of toxin-antitoxin system